MGNVESPVSARRSFPRRSAEYQQYIERVLKGKFGRRVSSRRVSACGQNSRGQFGTLREATSSQRAAASSRLLTCEWSLFVEDVVSIACGRDFVVLLCASGQVFSSGANDLGQLGLGDFYVNAQQCFDAPMRVDFFDEDFSFHCQHDSGSHWHSRRRSSARRRRTTRSRSSGLPIDGSTANGSVQQLCANPSGKCVLYLADTNEDSLVGHCLNYWLRQINDDSATAKQRLITDSSDDMCSTVPMENTSSTPVISSISSAKQSITKSIVSKSTASLTGAIAMLSSLKSVVSNASMEGGLEALSDAFGTPLTAQPQKSTSNSNTMSSLLLYDTMWDSSSGDCMDSATAKRRCHAHIDDTGAVDTGYVHERNHSDSSESGADHLFPRSGISGVEDDSDVEEFLRNVDSFEAAAVSYTDKSEDFEQWSELRVADPFDDSASGIPPHFHCTLWSSDSSDFGEDDSEEYSSDHFESEHKTLCRRRRNSAQRRKLKRRRELFIPEDVKQLISGFVRLSVACIGGSLFEGCRMNCTQPSIVRSLLKARVSVRTACVGSNHALFVSESGRVYGVGLNSVGQVGVARPRIVCKPVPITFVRPKQRRFSHFGEMKYEEKSDEKEEIKIEKVSAGSHHSLALDASGRVWFWGLVTAHQWQLSLYKGDSEKLQKRRAELAKPRPLHFETIEDRNSKTAKARMASRKRREGSGKAKAEDCGDSYSFAEEVVGGHSADDLIDTGYVEFPGFSSPKAVLRRLKATLLSADRSRSNSPMRKISKEHKTDSAKVSSLPLTRRKIVGMDSGEFHSAFVTDSGTVFTLGRNEHGQLGVSSGLLISEAPVHVCILSDVRVAKVKCGRDHCVALATGGALYSWGANRCGQCLNEDGRKLLYPRMVGCDSQPLLEVVDVLDVFCGNKFTFITHT